MLGVLDLGGLSEARRAALQPNDLSLDIKPYGQRGCVPAAAMALLARINSDIDKQKDDFSAQLSSKQAEVDKLKSDKKRLKSDKRQLEEELAASQEKCRRAAEAVFFCEFEDAASCER